MGEVVDVGSEVKNLKRGDRVVVPFTIACGECFFCKRGLYSGCERTNPDKAKVEKLWGHSSAGLFGYSHLLGGYAGGQAEYLRVHHADVGPAKVPEGLNDEQVLFLSDIFPTGYKAADRLFDLPMSHHDSQPCFSQRLNQRIPLWQLQTFSTASAIRRHCADGLMKEAAN
jgi:threonine dehydrogenase-like Zn-dependent dehydrogenase